MSHNTSSKSTVSMDPSSLSSWTGQKVGREKKRYSVRIFHLNINFPHIINIQGGDIKHPILFTIAINSFNCIDYAPFLTITSSEQRKANAWQPRGSTRKKMGKWRVPHTVMMVFFGAHMMSPFYLPDRLFRAQGVNEFGDGPFLYWHCHFMKDNLWTDSCRHCWTQRGAGIH